MRLLESSSQKGMAALFIYLCFRFLLVYSYPPPSLTSNSSSASKVAERASPNQTCPFSKRKFTTYTHTNDEYVQHSYLPRPPRRGRGRLPRRRHADYNNDRGLWLGSSVHCAHLGRRWRWWGRRAKRRLSAATRATTGEEGRWNGGCNTTPWWHQIKCGGHSSASRSCKEHHRRRRRKQSNSFSCSSTSNSSSARSDPAARGGAHRPPPLGFRIVSDETEPLGRLTQTLGNKRHSPVARRRTVASHKRRRWRWRNLLFSQHLFWGWC